MILGIVTRIDKKKSCNRLYIVDYYKKVFDKLNITLFPIISKKNINIIANICDAVIIPGSVIHINPKYYNEIPIEDINYNIDEYALDKEVINAFHSLNKPILGICAGIQSINVFFGGSLNQKIENHYIEDMHSINIVKNSFIYKVFNNEKRLVNSIHTQSIKKVANNFKVTAKADDGTIEAIEMGNIIGVQWHPEREKNIEFFKQFIEEYISNRQIEE